MCFIFFVHVNNKWPRHQHNDTQGSANIVKRQGYATAEREGLRRAKVNTASQPARFVQGPVGMSQTGWGRGLQRNTLQDNLSIINKHMRKLAVIDVTQKASTMLA